MVLNFLKEKKRCGRPASSNLKSKPPFYKYSLSRVRKHLPIYITNWLGLRENALDDIEPLAPHFFNSTTDHSTKTTNPVEALMKSVTPEGFPVIPVYKNLNLSQHVQYGFQHTSSIKTGCCEVILCKQVVQDPPCYPVDESNGDSSAIYDGPTFINTRNAVRIKGADDIVTVWYVLLDIERNRWHPLYFDAVISQACSAKDKNAKIYGSTRLSLLDAENETLITKRSKGLRIIGEDSPAIFRISYAFSEADLMSAWSKSGCFFRILIDYAVIAESSCGRSSGRDREPSQGMYYIKKNESSSAGVKEDRTAPIRAVITDESMDVPLEAFSPGSVHILLQYLQNRAVCHTPSLVNLIQLEELFHLGNRYQVAGLLEYCQRIMMMDYLQLDYLHILIVLAFLYCPASSACRGHLRDFTFRNLDVLRKRSNFIRFLQKFPHAFIDLICRT